MSIPIGIWEVEIALALLCTAHSWFSYDQYNYTDVISGILGFVFWITSDLSLIVGIQSEDMAYQGGWLTWIFIGIAVVVGLISVVKLIDVIRIRKTRFCDLLHFACCRSHYDKQYCRHQQCCK